MKLSKVFHAVDYINVLRISHVCLLAYVFDRGCKIQVCCVVLQLLKYISGSYEQALQKGCVLP
jgi:hypothetical protein